jgi:WXXGXW repeat (2 copies)
MLVKSVAFVFANGMLITLLAVMAPAQPPAPVPVDEPEVPKGIDVQARGPVHEAFANPSAESGAIAPVPKKPPLAIEEMPPAEKPEGQVAWIGGYWHYDDDRKDFLWVSGCWRTTPPGRQWIGGYWREQGDQWQWVSGFWAANTAQAAPAAGGQPAAAKPAELTYYPEPPKPPQVAPPGPQPSPDTFYMPGAYVWRDGRYVWVAGYWSRVQPGYMWVPGHYRWSPYGYVYVPGYWDYALARRGMLYAPVVVDVRYVGPGFVYTPAYAVSDVVLVDAFWVRPARCHYYFGDYYGPVYRGYGFECGFVYSQRNYDAIIVYRGWEYRDNPRWHEAQLNIYIARDGGRSPLPPRTLVEQRLVIRERGPGASATVMLAPASRVAADRGIKVVALNKEARMQEKVHAEAVHQAVQEHRLATESAKAGPPTTPRSTALPSAAGRQATATTPAAAAHTPATAGPAAKSPAVSGPTAAPATKAGSLTPPAGHPLQANQQHGTQQQHGGAQQKQGQQQHAQQPPANQQHPPAQQTTPPAQQQTPPGQQTPPPKGQDPGRSGG